MEIEKVIIPQLGVNDEQATLIEWLKKDNEKVKAGDQICVIETTKTTFELEAEKSGYLYIKEKAGSEIKINGVIGYIVPSLNFDICSIDDNNENTRLPIMRKKDKFVDSPSKHNIVATTKAQTLARNLGLDIGSIKKSGYIRQKDVLSFAKVEKKLAIYGAGNGGRTVKECVSQNNIFEVAFFIDDNKALPAKIEGIRVLKEIDFKYLEKENVKNIFVAIANGNLRLRVINKIIKAGFRVVNVIHPSAYISPTAKIGIGNYIKAGAIIESCTSIGDGCIIDNGVVIPHDNIIGNGCHLAPGVSLGSSVEIGDNSIVGIGSSVSTNIKVGNNSIIAVGTSVVVNVPDFVVIEGVPGRIVGKRK